MTAADTTAQAPAEADPTNALGRAIARRFRGGPRRLGALATSSRRFAAGTGRPLVARRALAARPVGRALGGPAQPVRSGALEQAAVRAPRWWDIADHAEPTADAETTPARRLPTGGLPARGLPRVVHAVPGEKPNRPGGVVASAAPRPVPMHLPAEVRASGSMLTPQDRRRRTAPAAPPTSGSPGASPGNAQEAGSRPQAPAGARAGSPHAPAVGPATAPPAPTGQYLRRRALSARTVTAARERTAARHAAGATSARPSARHVAPALDRSPARGGDGTRDVTASGARPAPSRAGTTTAPAASSAAATSSGPADPSTLTPGAAQPATGSPATASPIAARAAQVTASTAAPRPLRRAIGTPVRARGVAPRAVSAPVPIDGHGTRRSAVRAAPEAHRLVAADADAAVPGAVPAAGNTTARVSAPGPAGAPGPTGAPAATSTTGAGSTPAPTSVAGASGPAVSRSAPGATESTRAAAAAGAPATGAGPADASPSDRPSAAAAPAAATAAGSTPESAPAAPVRRAVASTPAATAASTDTSADPVAPTAATSPPTRPSFSGLPLGLTSITGRRAVRRLTAGNAGSRALSVRGHAHAVRPAPTASSGPVETSHAAATAASALPAAPSSAPAAGSQAAGSPAVSSSAHADAAPVVGTRPVTRATEAPRSVTERAASAGAVVGRVGAARPAQVGSAQSTRSAAPIAFAGTGAGGSGRTGAIVAVRRLMRSDSPRPTTGLTQVRPTAHRGTGGGATSGSPGGPTTTTSPLGIAPASSGARSWAAVRRSHPHGPGRAAGLATPAVPVIGGPSGHGASVPRTARGAATPTAATGRRGRRTDRAGAPTVRRAWYTRGHGAPVDLFAPEKQASGTGTPGAGTSAERSTTGPSGSAPVGTREARSTTSPSSTGAGTSPAGTPARSSATGPGTIVRRRSAADGRAVVPPRTAPARPAPVPASSTGAPPTPAVARSAGAPASGAGTAALSGPQRLEQALIRRAMAETGSRSPSVLDRISQFESFGSQEGSAMSMSALAPGQPPQVPPSALAFRRDELDPAGSRWDDPDDELLDTVVDRVVERIEDRVVEEIERRGRHRSPGVF